MEFDEGQKATLWVAGCIGELRRLDLVDGPKLTTPKGIAAFDQLDAGRDRLDPELISSRATALIELMFKGILEHEAGELHDCIMLYYNDRDRFEQMYPEED